MPFSEIEMSPGSSLSYSTTFGGAYTTAVGVRSIRWAGSRPSANVSALADLSTVKKRKRRDPGTITTDNIFQKTQYDALFDIHLAGTEYYWKITTAGGSVLGPFFGHISEFGLDIPEDDPDTFPMTIECSGGGTGGTEGFAPA